MNFNQLVETIEQMSGNYFRRIDDIYVLPANIDKLPEFLDNCYDFQSILITPFLINMRKDAFYELYYYEFEIEVRDIPKSHYIEHRKENALPKEIVENIKPKAIISREDNAFLKSSLISYLAAMKKMTFEIDKLSNVSLKDSSLYFQIY
jgi:hypothetical protein